jgi:hypothetical protein
MPLIRSDDVLGQIAPAVLSSGFVGMLWSAQLSGDVHRLAAEMDAGGFAHWVLLVVVFLESHG